MIGGRAGRALDELVRRVETPMAVNVLAQPGEQGGEVPAGERLAQVAEVTVGLGEQLRREQIAECVSREVAEKTRAPVNVLEAAFGIVARSDAEVLAIAFVPNAGDITDRQVARGAPVRARSG